jgi:hypothetical protein
VATCLRGLTDRQRKINYSGLDDRISRLSFPADDNAGTVGTHLEEYSYLGLNTAVQRAPTASVFPSGDRAQW